MVIGARIPALTWLGFLHIIRQNSRFAWLLERDDYRSASRLWDGAFLATMLLALFIAGRHLHATVEWHLEYIMLAPEVSVEPVWPLLTMYQYTLLPAAAFWHTVLQWALIIGMIIFVYGYGLHLLRRARRTGRTCD